MLSFVTNYLSAKPTTTTPSAGSQIEHSLTSFIKKHIKIDQAPKTLLKDLQNRLKKIDPVGSSKMIQEIDLHLNSAKRLALETKYYKQKSNIVGPQRNQERSYVQHLTASIEETKNSLKPLAGQLDSIQLCLVDDDLMAFVAQEFPDLKSLRLVSGIYDDVWDSFTDKGLDSIAQLKKLNTLIIDAWNSLATISDEGLTKLLSQSQFLVNITDLEINTFFIVDSILAVVGKYQKLRRLSIEGSVLTDQGLSSLLKSPSLKTMIADFSFYNTNSSPITDANITFLKDFKALERLNLGAGMDLKISTPVFLNFLDAHKNLKSLDIKGLTIDGIIAEKLGLLTDLESLHLYDCSKIPREKCWDLFFKNKSKLFDLNLLNNPTLDEENIVYVVNSPLTSLSLNMGKEWWADPSFLGTICGNDTLRRTLKKLHLTHLNNFKPDVYQYFKGMVSLNHLRIDASPWFNHDSLKYLSQAPISQTIETLELIDTSIDDSSIPLFTQFSKIKNILLGNCHAITKDGYAQILNLQIFKDQIEVITFEYCDWTFGQLWLFILTFKALKILVVSNGADLQDSEWDVLFEAAQAKKIAVIACAGITGYREIFEGAIKEVPNVNA